MLSLLTNRPYANDTFVNPINAKDYVPNLVYFTYQEHRAVTLYHGAAMQVHGKSQFIPNVCHARSCGEKSTVKLYRRQVQARLASELHQKWHAGSFVCPCSQ